MFIYIYEFRKITSLELKKYTEIQINLIVVFINEKQYIQIQSEE